jgi:hypothetical protein
MALGSTKPLTEMSTRNLPWGGGGGGKERPAREADLTTICELTVKKMPAPPRPVTGIALPFYFLHCVIFL